MNGKSIGNVLGLLGRRYSALLLLLLFVVTFSLLEPGIYLTPTTIKLILTDQVVVAILALGALVPIAANSFDVSLGAVLGFGLVVSVWLSVNTRLPEMLIIVITIVACAAVGAVNGFFVVVLGVDSFIATLGMSEVLAAICLYISGNRQISGQFSTAFRAFPHRQLFGITYDVYFFVALAFIFWIALEYTPAGRYVFATGGNREAARLCGVPVDRVTWTALVVSGVTAGVASLIFASKVGIYSNSFGTAQLFPAFAAVFFGATQVKGRINVWGMVLALVALAFGEKGLQLLGADFTWWVTPLFDGVALLAAVSLAAREVRRRDRATVSVKPRSDLEPIESPHA